MDTFKAFAMGQANAGKELMVFDWAEAARRIKASGTDHASAGLRSDWEWTGGIIFDDGQPYMDGYTYLASTWAVPELDVGNGPEACYRMQSETPGWDSGTKWPEEALEILK
jgi:hypothetical protein